MGFLILALLGTAALSTMALLGVRRLLWGLAGAALMLGATGYALQGRPSLRGQAARPQLAVQSLDPVILNLRDRMLGRPERSGDGAYIVAADAMRRAGEDGYAVKAIIGGIRRVPNSLMLWVGLGEALAAHDGGRVSPPALFAFRQALRISPEHPAPPFFLGLAYVREGNFAAARPYWARALTLSPEGSSYREEIGLRLLLLDRYVADTEGGPTGQ